VQDLNNGDDTNASFYAGLLLSTFPLAEASTAMLWGTLYDHYGPQTNPIHGLGGHSDV
jgi:hypothetical protein